MAKEFNCKFEEEGKLYVDEIDKESMLFEVSGFEVERVDEADEKFCRYAMTVTITKQDVRSLLAELELWLNAN